MWNTNRFEKCAEKINSLKENSYRNRVVYTFLEDYYTIKEAKAACKKYNAKILSSHKKLESNYKDKETSEVFRQIRLDLCNWKCVNQDKNYKFTL